MSRLVWPQAFLLHARAMREAHRNGLTKNAADESGAPRDGEFGEPVVLRWSTNPLVGFARQPFEVFKRLTGIRDIRDPLLSGVRTVSGSEEVRIEWPSEVCYVRFRVTPQSGKSVVVLALDARGEPVPGQRLQFSAVRNGRFRCPGVTGLLLLGDGEISNVTGINQHAYANLPDWRRVQVVGFPFADGELAPNEYATEILQGFEVPSLGGMDAALSRLTALRLLSLPPQSIGDATIPDPTWEFPAPDDYLRQVRDPVPGPLHLIGECLRKSDDLVVAKRQAIFRFEATINGIQQAGSSTGSSEPAVANIPVAAIMAMTVGRDGDAATALGYGTIDFPTGRSAQHGDLMVPGTFDSAFDYMVVNKFVFPFAGTLELAALVQDVPEVSAPTSLSAERTQGNRPVSVDQPETEVVEVSWTPAAAPQGYFIVASRRAGEAEYLNEPRGLSAGFEPLLPENRAPVNGVPPADHRTRFLDEISPVPFDGSRLDHYLVIARDIFTAWSSWSRASRTSDAPAVLKPGLFSVALPMDVDAAVGKVVPASIEVELSWDWDDRTPDRIEVVGRFFDGPFVPTPPTGMALSEGAVGTPVEIRFSTSGAPSIASGHAGRIDTLSGSPDAERRKYRLILENAQVDFATHNEVRYAVWARAAEAVRPGVLSDFADPPRSTDLADPLPTDPPIWTPNLQWTALAGADRNARGILSWPTQAGADGYFVWEATEAALRTAVDSAATPPADGTPALARAVSLSLLLEASVQNHERSLQAFTRLDERRLTDTQREVVLPAESDALHVYRVSTVTSVGVESERSSSFTLFAVPKRNVPGQPAVLLRKVDTPTAGVMLIALPGSGAAPAGYRVHRVRRRAAAIDVGTMGPPRLDSSDAGWTAHVEPSLRGPGQAGMRIVDPVVEDWLPYYYRIVAVGTHDPGNGFYAGESLASSVQSIVLPPIGPPILDSVSLEPETAAGATSNRVLTFRTDLPTRECPLGPASISIARLSVGADGRMQRTSVLEAAADQVEESTLLAPLASPTATELAAMPEIVRGPVDATGSATYSVRMTGEVEQGNIIVIDPAGRVEQHEF